MNFFLYSVIWLSLMGISECLTFYQAKEGTFFLFDLALFSFYYTITKEWPVVVNGKCQSTV